MQGLAQNQYNATPASISITIVVRYQQTNLNLTVAIDPDIPFNSFIEGIQEQVLANIDLSKKTIEYESDGHQYTPDERRSLMQLGLYHYSILHIRIK